jgi:serine/threonine protein kinase
MNEISSHDFRALPIGTTLSDYRIDGILGQGSFGITYLALDTMLNRRVAIKDVTAIKKSVTPKIEPNITTNESEIKYNHLNQLKNDTDKTPSKL